MKLQNNILIIKYTTNPNISEELETLIMNEIEEKMDKEFLMNNVHSIDNYNFFLIGDKDTHNQLKEIMSIDSNKGVLQSEGLSKIIMDEEDVTNEVINNFEQFDSMENIYSGENVLLKEFYSSVDSEMVLEKLADEYNFDVTKLNKHEMQILNNESKRLNS